MKRLSLKIARVLLRERRFAFVGPGRSPCHVVLSSAGTYIDPFSDYGTVARAASVEEAFLEYSLFAWVDSDGNGSFDPDSGEFGFYFGTPGATNTAQSVAPNIIVTDRSIADVDI